MLWRLLLPVTFARRLLRRLLISFGLAAAQLLGWRLFSFRVGKQLLHAACCDGRMSQVLSSLLHAHTISSTRYPAACFSEKKGVARPADLTVSQNNGYAPDQQTKCRQLLETSRWGTECHNKTGAGCCARR